MVNHVVVRALAASRQREARAEAERDRRAAEARRGDRADRPDRARGPDVTIRSAAAAGHGAVRRFLQALSLQSVQSRFFTAIGRVPERLVTALTSSDDLRHSFVAEVDGQVVGHGMWSRLPGAAATVEVAVVVADDRRRQGIGSELVRHALRGATAAGARSAIFTVRSENKAIIAMIRKGWPQARAVFDEGVLEYAVPLGRGVA